MLRVTTQIMHIFVENKFLKNVKFNIHNFLADL